MSQQNSATLSYRAEIDGLRAVAVASVFLYHAQFILNDKVWFEGGILGVDIFFVISGYFIARIIFSELFKNGSFSFKNFYEKRARRILPMLFVVILASIPFAWLKLLPSDFVEYAESSLSALFFVSNIFFYTNTTEYGTASALLKPLLHTWSLGVEVQFYLAFPVLSLLAFKAFRQHCWIFFIVVTVLSLLLADAYSAQNQSMTYYLPFTRLWQFTLGSLLAYHELKYRSSTPHILKHLLAVLGLALTLYSIIFFDHNTPHPSFHTLIPMIGVALMIAFVSEADVVGKILGSKPFVWLGLISYSAYLWHFPIFAFSRMGDDPTNFDKLLWIALTIVLSIPSYHLIENPFRKNIISRKKVVTFICLCLSAISLHSIYILWNFVDKNIEDNARVHANSLLDKGAFLNAWKEQALNEQHLTNFDEQKTKKVLIVGNSHGVDFFRVLQAAPIYHDIDFGLISQNPNTGNYELYCFYRDIVEKQQPCGNKNTVFEDVRAKFDKADLIILKTRWSDADILVLEDLIDTLHQAGKKIIVAGNSFEQQEKIPLREFVRANQRRPNKNELTALERTVFETAEHEKVDKIDAKLREISARKHVPFLETKDLFCDYPAKTCKIFSPDGFLLLWDYGHLSVKGADYVGHLLPNKKWAHDLLK